MRDLLMRGDGVRRISRKIADLNARLASLDAWRAQQMRGSSRLAASSAQDSTNGIWLYSLAALAVVFAGLSVWLWRERGRAQPEQIAWFASEEASDEAARAQRARGRAAAPAATPANPGQPRRPIRPDPEREGPSTWPPRVERARALVAVTAATSAVPLAASAPPATQGASLDREVFSRPLSGQEQVQVDEMMDIGHLADFFIGIGNLEQAVEVMRKALSDRSDGMLALPYLYLFDLYRQMGRKDDYVALLEQFAHRFNVHIPAWDEAMPEASRDLESYPRAIALICETWDLPPMVTVIERMLLDDPNKPRVGFDLPAYRDLLDLYAIARDLARNPAQEADPEPSQVTAALVPASAAMAPATPDELDFPLDLGAIAQPGVAANAPTPEVSAGSPPALPVKRSLPPLDFTLDDTGVDASKA